MSRKNIRKILREKSSKNTKMVEYPAIVLDKNMVLMQNVCEVGAN